MRSALLVSSNAAAQSISGCVAVGASRPISSSSSVAADAKAAPSKPSAPNPGAGGGKKKKDKAVKPKSPDSGHKWGHGADARPHRRVARQQELEARVKAAKTPPKLVDDKGALFTDDEEMQQLYNLVGSGKLDGLAAEAAAARKAGQLPDLPPGLEEPHEIADALSHWQYSQVVAIPDELKDKAAIVEDDMDYLAVTDQELSEFEKDRVADSDLEKWAKRGGARPRNQLERQPGAALARESRAGRTASAIEALPGMASTSAAAAAELEAAGGVLGDGSDAEASDSGAWRAVIPTVRAHASRHLGSVSSQTPVLFSPLLPLFLTSHPPSAAGVRISGLLSPEELAAKGLQYDDDNPGDVMGAPILPPPGQRASLTRRTAGDRMSLPLLFGEASAAAETDALHGEQARALLEAAGKGKPSSSGGDAISAASPILSLSSSSSSLLSDDGSSDWGGDPLDMRFQRDPRLAYADYKSRHGLRDTDSEIERLLNAGVDEEDDSRISPAFSVGGRIESLPSAVMEELAVPYDFATHGEEQLYPPARTVREAAMTPEERVLDEQRKALRDLIERPLPMVNRPLWPTYAMIVGVDQVAQVVSGGMIQSTRCMIVVGNGMGGAGFGMGKHKEPFMATKQALANAHRDMIHVSTHKGQLYHDLIGKKNSVYVIIRTLPSGSVGCKGAPLVQDVFEMMGVTHASAKIVGSKRRNPYTVVQALFDAFNHHVPPEDEAFKRGLRMQWMGADRVNGRTVFPWIPTGPRYPHANARHVTGTDRA